MTRHLGSERSASTRVANWGAEPRTPVQTPARAIASPSSALPSLSHGLARHLSRGWRAAAGTDTGASQHAPTSWKRGVPRLFLELTTHSTPCQASGAMRVRGDLSERGAMGKGSGNVMQGVVVMPGRGAR